MPEIRPETSRDHFLRRRLVSRLHAMRWLLGAVAGLALVAFATWVMLVSTWLGVRDVRISGVQHVSSAQVEQAAAIAPDTPLARVDTAAAEQRVEQVPGIAEATVRRAWPHGVRIEVVESTAVAVVVEGDTYTAIDDEGVLFRRLRSAPHRLPLVRVENLAPEGRDAALAEVAEVVSSLEPGIARRVDHVELSSIDSIVLALRDGDEVLWGSADASPRKADVLAALLDIEARVYDVSVPEQPTTRS